jgi:hypothetical protein
LIRTPASKKGDVVVTFVVDEDNYLKHYGIRRKSGRYPWGSGEDEYQRSVSFLGMVQDLSKQGMSPVDIAKSFSTEDTPFTTTDLRATTTIARNAKRAADIAMAQRLKYQKGLSNGAIAERMGLAGESSVRSLLDPSAQARTDQLQDMATMLKQQVDKKGAVDIGVGVERYTGSSRTQFDTAVAMLKSEGYAYHKIQEDQAGSMGANKTVVKVLAKPGTTYKDLVVDKSQIKLLDIVANDEGKNVEVPPFLSFDSKRLGIRYAEDGGTDADGVIFVRPGVKDTSLGGSHYAQVRVMVDGTHYLKGMAIYKDDLPDGVDLQFNTNKSNTGNKLDALKEVKRDKATGKIVDDDPFGSQTKDFNTVQNVKDLFSPDGSKRISVMNLVNEEGDWGKWSKNLASQMLSKQQPKLAKEQLGLMYSKKKADFDEISSLTNPAVKKELLKSLYDDLDSSAVHLKAAAMPRQATQVILPVPGNKIKPTEIFAPNFKDGERVVLVRYPHGGVFEIPELTVNNKNPTAVALIGKAAKDAVGIHPKVAEQLSGADFDGDTVLVIPNNSGQIKTKSPLSALKDFNPKEMYGPYDGMTTIDGGKYNGATKKVDYGDKSPSGKRKQTEMGKVSNLITDMTIKGANDQEIARAVRHSMVVIDAEKHHLNFTQSAVDNGIAQLKTKYQGGATNGAKTIISRSAREIAVPHRKQGYRVDPLTGKRVYNYTGEGYYTQPKVLKNGTVKEPVWVPKTTKSKEGNEVDNAFDLIDGVGQPIERVYAEHANKLKALADTSRKEWANTKPLRYSPSAKQVYAPEVSRLNAALNVALKNAPQERQAQLVANAIVRQKRDANPDMDREELKKISGKALVQARQRVGAGKTLIDISDREWEAIQAGAISNEKLEQILRNSDIEKLKALATPREPRVMTDSKQARAEQLLSSGRTAREVADILGVPLSTLTSSVGKDG